MTEVPEIGLYHRNGATTFKNAGKTKFTAHVADTSLVQDWGHYAYKFEFDTAHFGRAPKEGAITPGTRLWDIPSSKDVNYKPDVTGKATTWVTVTNMINGFSATASRSFEILDVPPYFKENFDDGFSQLDPGGFHMTEMNGKLYVSDSDAIKDIEQDFNNWTEKMDVNCIEDSLYSLTIESEEDMQVIIGFQSANGWTKMFVDTIDITAGRNAIYGNMRNYPKEKRNKMRGMFVGPAYGDTIWHGSVVIGEMIFGSQARTVANDPSIKSIAYDTDNLVDVADIVDVHLPSDYAGIPVLSAEAYSPEATVDVVQPADASSPGSVTVTAKDGESSITSTINFSVLSATTSTLEDLMVNPHCSS